MAVTLSEPSKPWRISTRGFRSALALKQNIRSLEIIIMFTKAEFKSVLVALSNSREAKEETLFNIASFCAYYAGKDGNKAPVQQAVGSAMPATWRPVVTACDIGRQKGWTKAQAEELASTLCAQFWTKADATAAKAKATREAKKAESESAKAETNKDAGTSRTESTASNVIESTASVLINAIIVNGETHELSAAEVAIAMAAITASRKPKTTRKPRNVKSA